MGVQVGNVVFIVWRETVEALLVVGILNAWLSRQTGAARTQGRLFLWSGVALGVLVAILLAAMLTWLGRGGDTDTQQIIQTVMVLVAAGLIVQMVFWMRRHGRTMKRDMEDGLSTAADQGNLWGLAVLALVAVAREGSEAVVFLYGTWAATVNSSPGSFVLAALLGIGAAVATYLVLQLGGRLLSWRLFFRVSEILLLCLAGALVVTAIDNLMSLELMPELSGRLWDSSGWLPDNGRVGGMLAALAGYRARPNLTEVVVLALYWATVTWLMFKRT